ncbi:MAG TPA: DUF669 domain-containing protein [Candidatus Olsenella stercoravium]|uniref:DUF669 domain-containing protein n=1 Tax=Candidatus Olsenella stercoravium TaxID=2838713 RepID=A0A9D2IPY4_9ACTN|nr:DUF669 domain-containing protein [Candidatus Olsenella stercoravium]
MPNINWDDVTESSGGGASILPSGAYKCIITSAEFVKTKKGAAALLVLWDVADGEHKGHFSDSFFDNKPFRHKDYLMLEGKALGVTKHKLHVLADANPSFKPTVAIGQDQAQPFVGKTCYLLLQERKYTYNGRDQSEVNVVRWLSPEEFRAGDFKVPDTIDERVASPSPAPVAAPTAPAIELADEDLPF